MYEDNDISNWETYFKELHRKFEEDRNGVLKNKLETQMDSIRKTKHQEYVNAKRRKVLIASDSMCNQLDEKRLSNKNVDVKVKCWGGCKISEMFNKAKSTMDETHFDTVILHVGTNDSTFKPSTEMIYDIIRLKQNIETTYSSDVIISNIIDRTDNGKASLTSIGFNEKLQTLKIRVLDNSNITNYYLGQKCHHLTSPYGTVRLAKKFIDSLMYILRLRSIQMLVSLFSLENILNILQK